MAGNFFISFSNAMQLRTLFIFITLILFNFTESIAYSSNDTVAEIQNNDSLKLVTDTATLKEETKATKGLTDEDYQIVADSLGIEVATIKSIVEIETGRCREGIIEPGIPLVNFDASIFKSFMRRANKSYSKYVNSPAFKLPNTRKYGTFGKAQWARLESARKIDKTIAEKATFWGMFQIGGFNWKKCGCASLEEFVDRMSTSEFEQLNLFAEFCKNSNLVKYLKDKNWAAFAYRYNGPGYKRHNYDGRLRRAYNKFKK